MHCTLLIPDLLLPRELGSEPYHELRTTALDTMLARGTTTSRAPVAYEEWLCNSLGVAKQQDVPVAAALFSADGGDAGNHYWLCADPIHVRPDRSRLVFAGRVDDIEAAEAREMLAALNRHFAGDGLEFIAPSPRRWYVRTGRVPRLSTTPSAHAVNRSVEPNLPRGDDAMAWHRIMNEAQMILHAHPANAAREERGAMVVNSLWLWGGGIMPAPSGPVNTIVWSHDPLARALVAATRAIYYDLPPDCAAWLAAASGEDHLLVCDGPTTALREADIPAWRSEVAALDANWITPLLTALRANKIALLRLVGCNSGNLLETTITRSNLWRFWRRARPLASYAADA